MSEYPPIRITHPNVVEIGGSATVHWRAGIYPRDGLTRLTIGLEHVRAADNLIIEYDGDRDGWVIRMDRTADMGGYADTHRGGGRGGIHPRLAEGRPTIRAIRMSYPHVSSVTHRGR